MQDLEGKVAVVTGGASGIGEGLAHACAEAGTKVVVSDIDAAGAKRVAEAITGKGGSAIAVASDVSDRTSVDALADATWNEFGGCHLLCNNAGVLHTQPILESTQADWDWVYAVNVRGVLNGVQAFVPRMLEQDGPAHVVNTGSVAGLIPLPGVGVYTTSKYAVVALSEVLRTELAETNVSVSVLCPAGVTTRIQESGRNRQEAFGGPVGGGAFEPDPEMATGGNVREDALQESIEPVQVAELVLAAVRADELYISTHESWGAWFEQRADAIKASFATAGRRRG